MFSQMVLAGKAYPEARADLAGGALDALQVADDKRDIGRRDLNRGMSGVWSR